MEQAVNLTEAAHRLGVSRTKAWGMVRDGELESYQDPLDKRQRLIPVRAIEEMLARRGVVPPRRPASSGSEGGQGPAPRHFVSDGIASNPSAVRSDRIEEYLREHWHPKC